MAWEKLGVSPSSRGWLLRSKARWQSICARLPSAIFPVFACCERFAKPPLISTFDHERRFARATALVAIWRPQRGDRSIEPLGHQDRGILLDACIGGIPATRPGATPL